MKSGLQQPDSREAALPRPIQYRLHEGPSNAAVLNVRRHRNRPDARNRRAFIHAVAADDAPVEFSHYAIESRMGEAPGDHTDSGFGQRQVRGKIVLAVDSGKCLVADAP